jgi:hypothetical protein
MHTKHALDHPQSSPFISSFKTEYSIPLIQIPSFAFAPPASILLYKSSSIPTTHRAPHASASLSLFFSHPHPLSLSISPSVPSPATHPPADVLLPSQHRRPRSFRMPPSSCWPLVPLLLPLPRRRGVEPELGRGGPAPSRWQDPGDRAAAAGWACGEGQGPRIQGAAAEERHPADLPPVTTP